MNSRRKAYPLKLSKKNNQSIKFSLCRFWHLVETSIEDSILAPLSKEWINNMNAMVPPHLLKLKEAYKNFWKVIITYPHCKYQHL